MRSVPAYSAGTSPTTFCGTIKQSGLLVWSCKHKHVLQAEAQACALAEREIMRSQQYMACPSCREDVDFIAEHFDLGDRSWFCAPKKTPTKRKRSSV